MISFLKLGAYRWEVENKFSKYTNEDKEMQSIYQSLPDSGDMKFNQRNMKQNAKDESALRSAQFRGCTKLLGALQKKYQDHHL